MNLIKQNLVKHIFLALFLSKETVKFLISNTIFSRVSVTKFKYTTYFTIIVSSCRKLFASCFHILRHPAGMPMKNYTMMTCIATFVINVFSSVFFHGKSSITGNNNEQTLQKLAQKS